MQALVAKMKRSMVIRRRGLNKLPEGWTGHPLLGQLMAARGVQSQMEADFSLRHLIPYQHLNQIEQAAAKIGEALIHERNILIVGDYDADGATSTALMVSVLRCFGAKKINFLVPDRFRFGYGLSAALVQEALSRKPDLIITVDNGISSVEGVALARAHGIDVVITDHHLPGEQLPEASAIVNPNVPGDPFPSKALAGVGVAFYVLAAVRAYLTSVGWFVEREAPRLSEWLDLVALGTVADVVPLDSNNRRLVHYGLQLIRHGRARPGIQALCAISGCDIAHLRTSDLAFRLAPRLNAAGRLDDMSIGIHCLLAESQSEAERLAHLLNELNLARQSLERDMRRQAESHVAETLAHISDAESAHVLCLADDSWHEGLVGLVASRIKERFHRPAFAFAPDEHGTHLKGSGRSIAGIHIRDVLAMVDARYPGMIQKFGGHAMAAGLTLPKAQFDAFTKAVDQAVRDYCGGQLPRHEVVSDGWLDERWMTLDVALALENVPWGQGFPEPLFEHMFILQHSQVVGGQHLKMRLMTESGKTVEAIWFGSASDGVVPAELVVGASLHLFFRVQVNRYRHDTRLQLLIEHGALDSGQKALSDNQGLVTISALS